MALDLDPSSHCAPLCPEEGVDGHSLHYLFLSNKNQTCIILSVPALLAFPFVIGMIKIILSWTDNEIKQETETYLMTGIQPNTPNFQNFQIAF